MDYIGVGGDAEGGTILSDNRLAGADFVRATACLMVVAHHVAQRISPNILTQGQASVAAAATMLAFGVAAFFVLSGYLLARPFWVALDKGDRMPSLRTYFIRRGARVLPAFWLNLTIVFLLSFTLLGEAFDGTLALRYAAGMLLVADFHWLTWFPVAFNLPLWSIGCEITSYVLLAFCLALLFRLPLARGWGARLLWLVFIAAIVGLQFLALRYWMPDSDMRGWQYGPVGGAKSWWPNYNPISFFAIFALGSLAAGIQVRLAALRSAAFDLVAIAGLGLAIWSISSNMPVADAFGLAGIPYGFPWFPAGVALILIAVPSSVLLRRVTDIAPIAFVARISFGIYIWHYFLMEVVRVLWQPAYVYWGMTDATQWAWISAGVVAASIAIATVSYYAFEEPIIRWARGLERRPSPTTPTLSPAAG